MHMPQYPLPIYMLCTNIIKFKPHRDTKQEGDKIEWRSVTLHFMYGNVIWSYLFDNKEF